MIAPKRERLPEALAVALGVDPGSDVATRISHGLGREVEIELLMTLDAVKDGRDPHSVATCRCSPIADPREAWEALATAGLIGHDDVECDGRRFEGYVTTMVGGLTYDAAWSPVLAHPPTVADCVAFASDWPGVLAAERMAGERYPGRPVLWRVSDHGPDIGRENWLSDKLPGLVQSGYWLDTFTDERVIIVAPAL